MVCKAFDLKLQEEPRIKLRQITLTIDLCQALKLL